MKIEIAIQFFVKFSEITFHTKLFFLSFVHREERGILKVVMQNMSMPNKSYLQRCMNHGTDSRQLLFQLFLLYSSV